MSDGRTLNVIDEGRILHVEEQGRVRMIEVASRQLHVASTGHVAITMTGNGGGHVHQQDAPASTWIIAHPLGRKPAAVAVYLGSGEMVDTDAEATDTTLTLTFPTPTAGTAVLS